MIGDALSFLATHWHLVLSVLIVLQAGSVALAILSERREPAATLAWLMTVTFLPVVGIILYYALARQRFRRQFRAWERSGRHAEEAFSMYVEQRMGDFDDQTLRALKPAQQGLAALAANSAKWRSGGHPFRGNDVELYFDGDQKFDALKLAIRSAESHVHLEYYIFRCDGIGMELCELLAERARDGVEVRVLCDGIGSLRALRSSAFRELRAAGAEVSAFLPPRFGRVIDRVNFRNHRKIAVIDGRVGFTGGMNVGDEYLGRDPKIGPWRDAHARITGPAVAELQRTFLSDWLFATSTPLAEPKYFPEVPPAGDELVQVVSSGPDCRWPVIQQLHFQAITTASTQVLIATPYFVPDPSTLVALKTAALRGVDVRVMLPRKTDVRIVTSAARSYYEELLETGVRIFEHKNGFLHSKTLAVDGRFGSVGSANMDIRSFVLNFELSAFVYGEKFGRALQKQFEADLADADEIDLDVFRERPRLKKFGQSVAQLLSGIL